MKEKSGKLKRIFKPTKKKVIIIVIVLIVIFGVVFYVRAQMAAMQAMMEEPLYNTAIVEKKDLTKEVSVNGTIGSVDNKVVESEVVNVKVNEVKVKVGDVVKAGDVICVLDSSDIDTQLENAQNNADIASAKANQALQDAQAGYDNTVAAGNSSNAAASQNTALALQTLNEAIATRDGANALYDQKQQALEKWQTLQNTPGASPEEIAAAEAEYNSIDMDSTRIYMANKAVEDAQVAYDQAVRNEQDQQRENQNALNMQSSAVTSAKLDQQTVNSGETAQTIEDLEEQKDACTVVAPIDGTITSLTLEAGDIYKGGEIAIIQNEAELLVNATVDQYTISDITEGMDVIIKTDTTGDLEMAGNLSFVSPVPKTSVDGNGTTTTSTDYEIKADFEEQNERLRLGMNAKTTIIIAEAKDVLSVPGSYIQTDGDKSFVTVLVDEATGETQDIDVTIGLETDYDVEVTGEGLEEGMQIILPESSVDDMEYTDAIYG